MESTGKQNITLKIGGKVYELLINPEKEELYRLGEREVNEWIARIVQHKYDGFAMQDNIAVTALYLAMSNIEAARSRGIGDEEAERIAGISDEIAGYLDKLDI